MAGVEENRALWEQGWDWSEGGAEWSRQWGGTDPLWMAALRPRIDPFLPAPVLLEIAPGFGRWSDYLKDECDRLILVDLTERCIEGCRERFADESHIEFHVNDGRSLPMVEDSSVDFVFSFDSLVHVELDVLEDYLSEIQRVLSPEGVAFIHHSNIGSYRWATRLARRVPKGVLPRLIDRGLAIDVIAWRAESVTAAKVAAACEKRGLRCRSQELISWEHGLWPIDAISILTPRGSRWDRPNEVLRNPLFAAEARRMRRLYSAP